MNRTLPLPAVGLLNQTGDLNCFLNTAIQALEIPNRWVIPELKLYLQNYTCPLPELENCLLCSLQSVFCNYEKALKSRKKVNITKIRTDLSKVFESSGLFEIGDMADSMEAMISILSAIHCVSLRDTQQGVNTFISDERCEGCPSHRAVSLVITDISTCECGEKIEQEWDYCSFVHPFYVNDLLDKGKEFEYSKLIGVDEDELLENIENSSLLALEGKLTEYMKKHWMDSEVEICVDDDCEVKKTKKTLRLVESPASFIINCIWSSKYPSEIEILQVMAAIPLTLGLDSVYESEDEGKYILKGLILFGHGHYIFVMRTDRNEWIKINDENCTVVEEGKWIDTVEDIVRKMYHPTGLVYLRHENNEEFEIGLMEWMKLEQKIVKIESDKFSVFSETTNERMNKNRFDILSGEKFEEGKGSHTVNSRKMFSKSWLCTCGVENDIEYKVCRGCGELKLGEKGWICKICTFHNQTLFSYCESCHEIRDSPKKVLYWQCSFCHQHNQTGSTICYDCKCKKSEKIGWVCEKCSSANPKSKNYCWSCHSPEKLCVECGEREQEKISNKCHQCEINSRPKPNNQSSKPGKTTQATPLKWVCVKCNSNNPDDLIHCKTCREFRYIEKCKNCFKIIHQGSVCDNCDLSVCGVCDKFMPKTAPKICYKCRTASETWVCQNCFEYIEKEKRICLNCNNNTWICSCKGGNWPGSKVCETCGRKKVNPGGVKSQRGKKGKKTAKELREPLKEVEEGKCILCKALLSENDKRTCPRCTNSDENDFCKRCGYDKTKGNLCSMCKKTKEICECGTHKVKNRICKNHFHQKPNK